MSDNNPIAEKQFPVELVSVLEKFETLAVKLENDFSMWERESKNLSTMKSKSARRLQAHALFSTKKVAPFRGVRDERTVPEFLREFRYHFRGLETSDPENYVYFLKELICPKSCPWARDLDKNAKYEDWARELHARHWDRRLRRAMAQRLQNIKYDPSSTSLLAFITNVVERIKDTEEISEEDALYMIEVRYLPYKIRMSLSPYAFESYEKLFEAVENMETFIECERVAEIELKEDIHKTIVQNLGIRLGKEKFDTAWAKMRKENSAYAEDSDED